MPHQLLSSTRSRAAAGPSDLPAIVTFYEQCEAVDQFDHTPSLIDLQRRLDNPPPGGVQYRQLWETPNGQLVGVASLWIDDPTEASADLEAWLGVRVHPDYRTGVLEIELLTWSEQQVLAKARAAQQPARLCAGVRRDRPYYCDLYEAQGYQPVRCSTICAVPWPTPSPRRSSLRALALAPRGPARPKPG
ncbi:MAG: hypothetical protein HC929_02895 [Leptolyngbyaceae cyanobacterium SM2_5_2]|nr:hypothetical protein [Leptolyngbyaceae cyanobacterium SM2_5_2]